MRYRKKKRFPLLLLLLILVIAFFAIKTVVQEYPLDFSSIFNIHHVADESRGWNLILVNRDNYIPKNYEVELTTLSNGNQVDSRIYPDLQAMFDDVVLDIGKTKNRMEAIMKTNKLITLSVVVALTLVLCGCAEKKEPINGTPEESVSVNYSSDEFSVTDSAVSEPTETETMYLETASTETSESLEKGNSSASSVSTEKTDYIATAKQLIEALNHIDNMGAGILATDSNKTVVAGESTYAKVTDNTYADTKAIKEYLTSNMTDNLISLRYSSLLGSNTPRFIDNNGELYQLQSARGGGFAFSDEAPQISEITDAGFTIKAQFDDFGAPATMTIKAVLEDEKWKIDSFDIE